MGNIRTLVADDHELFRMGVVSLLNDLDGFEVVGESSTGEETLAFIHAHSPDLLVLDYTMPDGNGVEVIQALSNQGLGNLAIILLTGVDSALVLEQAIESGASAVVAKRGRGDDLVNAIKAVRQNEQYISDAVRQVLDETQVLKSLTRRETQVLVTLLEGAGTREVAERLGVSFKTAETHKTRVMQKLDVHSTQELIALAQSLGLMTLM